MILLIILLPPKGGAVSSIIRKITSLPWLGVVPDDPTDRFGPVGSSGLSHYRAFERQRRGPDGAFPCLEGGRTRGKRPERPADSSVLSA